MWFDAARWCYNETIAWLKRTGEPANWKAVKTGDVRGGAPEYGDSRLTRQDGQYHLVVTGPAR